MKKEDYRSWLSERVAHQTGLVIGAAAVMMLAGMVSFCLEWSLFKAIIEYGFIGIGFIAWLMGLGIVSAVLYFTWLRMPARLADAEYPVVLNDVEETVRVAPAMGIIWTYALGSLESDRSWAERLLGFLALPQRLLCGGWYALNRVKDLRELDIPACAAVVRLLVREGELVLVSQIAEKVTNPSIPTTLRQLSLIDGVAFLAHPDVGVTVTPRLTDDLSEWKGRHRTAAEGRADDAS